MPRRIDADEVEVSDPQPHGESALAAAVLQQAVRDLTGSKADAAERASAAYFLRVDNPLFILWCAVGAVRPHAVLAMAAKYPATTGSVLRWLAAESGSKPGQPRPARE